MEENHTPQYGELIRKHALPHHLDPLLVAGVIWQESLGHPLAVSRTGAKGLMQLMPAMCRAFDVKDPFDPDQNIRGGCALLAEEMTRYRGHVLFSLAAYNAGSPKVNGAKRLSAKTDYWTVSKLLPDETRNYVTSVLWHMASGAAKELLR